MERTLPQKLSIVATMYRSAPYLREFYTRCVGAAEKVCPDFELVLVNDGSPDESLDIAVALHETDPRVKVVDLSRNFGHHKAMMTGLMHADGDMVFLLDSDLEEPPELLEEFWRIMREDPGLDVVYGVQERRKGGFFERWSGRIFFLMMKMVSQTSMPFDIITARLMTRRYVSALVQHLDREVFMLGLWVTTGFKQLGVRVKKGHKGDSSYGLARKLSLVANAITGFSNRPLYFIFLLGLTVSFISFALAAYYLGERLFIEDTAGTRGFTTLVMSIWMVGGLNMLCLGVIGVYLAKMFSEVKERPYTVVRQYLANAGDRNNEQ